MRKDIAIINYNTPELTAAAVMSAAKHTPGCHCIIFDNSDRYPFDAMLPGTEIIDNTHGQLIDFDTWLASIPGKTDVGNNWASAKHCKTVQWLLDNIDHPVMLMDSDVLVRRDISPLWDDSKAWVGHVYNHHTRFGGVDRVHPCLCYLNIPLLRANGVTYFNQDKMHALSSRRHDNAYDTGCWFLEDCRRHGLPGTDIPDLGAYILHLGSGSWRRHKMAVAAQWLEDNKELWT